MKGTILKVFLIIAVLVLALMAWSLTFGDGGIVESVYNGVTSPINTAWAGISGSNEALIPPLEISGDGATLNQDGDGVDVNNFEDGQ
jgi:hypothetical protein